MKEQTSSYLYNHNLYCSVGVIFSALYISAHCTDISCTTTPSWMKKRLRSSGWGLASNWLKSLQPQWCCRQRPSSAPALSRTWALFLTVNLLWLTTSRLSASRASFSYDSCEQSKSRCRQTHVRHSSRRSHTADWITAPARLSVSQASSGSACSPYRMQRLAWLSVPASVTPSLLHCVISTGCQCANLSTLRWAYWHTSASMAWLHSTWRQCSCRQYHSSNASNCVRRWRARLVQLRGTICPQNFDDRTCQWLCFVDYWRTRYSLQRTLTVSALGAMR